jgi:hypothetical protein
MSSIKEQSAIKIQRWIKHKSIWEWRDDYSGNCDNVKTNNKQVNILMDELDDTLGGGSCWNIGFSALTRYIVKLETTNKELILLNDAYKNKLKDLYKMNNGKLVVRRRFKLDKENKELKDEIKQLKDEIKSLKAS